MAGLEAGADETGVLAGAVVGAGAAVVGLVVGSAAAGWVTPAAAGVEPGPPVGAKVGVEGTADARAGAEWAARSARTRTPITDPPARAVVTARARCIRTRRLAPLALVRPSPSAHRI